MLMVIFELIFFNTYTKVHKVVMSLSSCENLTIPKAYEEIAPVQRVKLEQIVDTHNSPSITLRDVSEYLNVSKVTLQARLAMCKTLWESIVIDSDSRCKYYSTEDFLILVFWCLNKHQDNIKHNKTGKYTICPRQYNP